MSTAPPPTTPTTTSASSKQLADLGRKRLDKYLRTKKEQRRTSEDSGDSFVVVADADTDKDRDAKVATLEDRIAQLVAELDKARASANSTNSNNSNNSSNTSNPSNPSNPLNENSLAKLAFQMDRIRQLEQMLAAATASSTTESTNEVAELTLKLDQQKDTVDSLVLQLQDASTAAASALQRLEEREAESSTLNAQIDHWKQLALSSDNAAQEARREADLAKKRLEDYVHENSSSHDKQLADSALKLKEKSDSIIDLTRAMEIQAMDLGTCAEKLNAAEKRVAELLVDNKSLMNQLAELRQSQITLQNEKIALVMELHAATQNVQKLQLEVVTLESLKEETKMLKDLVRSIPSPELEALTSQIQSLRQSLAEERHRTELLAMELECIPDYIQLYHKERKLLKKGATTANGADVVGVEQLVPVPKVPKAVRSVLGERGVGVGVGPCADCTGRVWVL
ncbi:hypothetical protein HDU79_007612 [Rhizoclosmatium sp. JEL0117]|nr:hypothetical protein HDU79_007612 [Rhizoclosmatium sp. JEL0117]